MTKKKRLFVRVLARLIGKKDLIEEKDSVEEKKMTQAELEKFYKDTYAECQYMKSNMSSLDKADTINNELWLTGQGG